MSLYPLSHLASTHTPWNPSSPEDYTQISTTLTATLASFCKPLGKCIVGVSGGIDSAVTLALAVHALGSPRVLAVHMPGPHTSARATRDAITLATNCGVELLTLPIQPIIEATEATLASVPKSQVATENLQARARALLLSQLGNRLGGIHLATGNKTELTYGYATLYGDLTGALAPIADLLKRDVYALAHTLNHDRPYIPDSIINAAPSAELAPDQTDPFHYPWHDALAQAFTEHHHTPDTLALHEKTFDEIQGTLNVDSEDLPPHATPATLDASARDAYQLYLNTWFKRVQAPPAVIIRGGIHA